MQRNFIRKYACNYFALVLVFPLELYFSRTFIPFKQFFLFTALELEYPVPEPRKTSSQFSRSQVSDSFFIHFFTFQFKFQGLKFSILFSISPLKIVVTDANFACTLIWWPRRRIWSQIFHISGRSRDIGSGTFEGSDFFYLQTSDSDQRYGRFNFISC